MRKNKVVGDLSNLINELSRKGFIRAASVVTDILRSFVLENEVNDPIDKPEYDKEVAELAKNIVGLTDSTVDNMNQGYSMEGFSSQYIGT